MTTCQTWACDRQAIAQLTIRRPCGHPVALNSSGDRINVRDGSPVAQVQRAWHCAAHIWARAGRPAPGPSTCPVCGVRAPVRTDHLVHAGIYDTTVDEMLRKPKLCDRPLEAGEGIVYDRSEPVTCPDCLEWMHA